MKIKKWKLVVGALVLFLIPFCLAMRDSITNADVVISYGHHEAHGGSAFKAWGADSAMSNNETIIIVFKTGPIPGDGKKKLGHVVSNWSSKSAATFELIEGCSWDAASGTAFSIYNRNRNSDKESIFLHNKSGSFVAENKFLLNPANLTGGTVIDFDQALISRGMGHNSRDDEEEILEANQTYAYRVTANANGNAAILRLSWYEHTNRK